MTASQMNTSVMNFFKSIICSIAAISFSSHLFAADNRQSIKMMTMMPDMGSTITLGGAKLPWGNQFVLGGNQAQARRGDRCAFGFAYEVSSSSNQSLRINKTTVILNSRPLHLGQPFILRAGDKKTVNGNLYLNNGVNNLQFRVDAANGTIEKTAAVLVSGC